MKKRLSILLALVMLVSVFSITTNAVNGPSDENYVDGDSATHYYASICFIDFNADPETEYDVFKDNTVDNNAISGATYDRESNTLTLTSFNHPELTLITAFMGNDFKVKVEGDNELDYVMIEGMNYGGSLYLEGDGLLVVNSDREYTEAVYFGAGGSEANFDIAEETSVKLYSSENAVCFNDTTHEDITTIFTDSGKDVENISREKRIEEEAITVEGIRVNTNADNNGYKVTKADDPNGIYSVNVYKDDDEEEYEVDKYIYIDGIGMYVSDPNFDVQSLTKEEFDAAGYSIVTSKNGPVTQSYDNPTDKDFDLSGFVIDGFSADDEPEGKDFMYVVDEYVLQDKSDDNHFYTLFKLTPSPVGDIFDIESQTDGLTYNYIKEQGFEFEYSDEEAKEPMWIVIKDNDGDTFGAVKLKKADDPNGIYALSDYPFYSDNYLVSITRIIRNDENGGYEIDDNFASEVSRSDFLDGTYTYRFEEVAEPFNAASAYIDELPVCATSDERNIAVDFYDEDVFSYNNRRGVEIDGKFYPIFAYEQGLVADDFDPLYETVEGNYDYKYNDPDYIKVKGDTTPDESEPNTTEVEETTEPGSGEDDGLFTAQFVTDENTTVNVYYTQDYTMADESDVTSAVARNRDTGDPDISGEGQINFGVVLADGYVVDDIKIDGGYKNLKDIGDNIYRVTKITSDLTITITTKQSDGEATTEPVETTAVPEETTANIEDTTAAAEDTTANPQDTTGDAQETTANPQDTTGNAQDTTGDTQNTTANPQDTTKAQGTTAKPQTTTAKPADTGKNPVEPAIKAIKKGVTASQADKFIKGLKTDKDPKGSKFGLLCARQKKVTKKAVTIRWNKLPKAKKYVVYSAKCSTKKGVMTPYKKTKTVKKTNFTLKKCKKGTYYKFLVVALDKNGKVLATSTTVHSTTKGGKYCNDKTVKVNKSSVTLKKGKTAKLKAKETPETKGKKVQRHRKVKYESSNPAVAKVNGKGKITAKKKGTAYIYVYPQNGLYKKVKVTVK